MNLNPVHGSKPLGYRAVGVGVAPSETVCKFVPIASFCTAQGQATLTYPSGSQAKAGVATREASAQSQTACRLCRGHGERGFARQMPERVIVTSE